MNKTELTNAVAEKAGLSKADSKKAVDAVIEAITEALKANDKVALIGFGTFATVRKEAHEGRNPSNGQTMTIPAKTVAKFTPGAELKSAVNE